MCSGNLTFVDVATGDINGTLGGTDLTIEETNITFTTQQLTENCRYNVIVTASNGHGRAISESETVISK